MTQPKTRTAYVSLETLNHLSLGGKAIVTHIDDDGIAHTEKVPDPVVAFGPDPYPRSSERSELFMPPRNAFFDMGHAAAMAAKATYGPDQLRNVAYPPTPQLIVDKEAYEAIHRATIRRIKYNRWFTASLIAAAFLLGGFAVYCWMVWPR